MLPPESDTNPVSAERLSVIVLACVPWLLVYEAFIIAGPPENAIITNLAFEKHLPVWEFSEVFYLFAFLFSLSVPFVIKTKRNLRYFITDIWFTTVFAGIIFFLFPFVVEQRSVIPHSFPGKLILFERSVDGVSGALPSGHVIWAFLSAAYFSKSFPKFTLLWYTLSVLISMSCIMTGVHSIADVFAGFVTFLIVYNRRETRRLMVRKKISGS